MEVRTSLTGAELRELVVAKFGRPYDTRLCQRRDRFNKLKMVRAPVRWVRGRCVRSRCG